MWAALNLKIWSQDIKKSYINGHELKQLLTQKELEL